MSTTRPEQQEVSSAPAPPVVFLDMDEVLCVHAEYNSQQMLKVISGQVPDWPKLFENLVDAGAAAHLLLLHQEFHPTYVISSTWSLHLDRDAMSAVLLRTNLGFVVENLHDAWQTPRALQSSRSQEVEWWLAEHRVAGQPFVILDDPDSGYTLAGSYLDVQGHVVLCERKIGFSGEKLAEARRILQRQMTPEAFGPAEDTPAARELNELESRLRSALAVARPAMGLTSNAQYQKFAGAVPGQFGAIVLDGDKKYVAWFSTGFVLESVQQYIESSTADDIFWRELFG